MPGFLSFSMNLFEREHQKSLILFKINPCNGPAIKAISIIYTWPASTAKDCNFRVAQLDS
jgi:hypothetical protein